MMMIIVQQFLEQITKKTLLSVFLVSMSNSVFSQLKVRCDVFVNRR